MKPARYGLRTAVAALLGLALIRAAAADTDNLDQGRRYYAQGQYALAADHLQQAFRDDPANIELNLLLGLAAFRAGDYETAAITFDRVLAMRPDLDRARLELARCYYHLKLYRIAEDLFREIEESPGTPEEIRGHVRQYRKRIGKLSRPHQLQGVLALSLVRDSNARISPDATVDIPGLPPLDVPLERDWFLAQSLVLQHQWQPSTQRLGWQTIALGYNAFYDQEDDLDVNYLRLDTGPTFSAGNTTLGLAVNASFLERDYDRFLGTVGARAWISRLVTQNLGLRLEWQAEERRYWQDPLADGLSNTLAAQGFWEKGPHALVVGMGVEAQNSDAGFETYDRWFTGLTYQLKLPWAMTAMTSYTYENWLFESPAPLSDRRRRDHVHEVAVALRKRFTPQLAVDVKHVFETSHSNTDLHDYDRNVSSLSVLYAF